MGNLTCSPGEILRLSLCYSKSVSKRLAIRLLFKMGESKGCLVEVGKEV